MRSLSAQSCDAEWNPQFTQRSANLTHSYKTVNLTEMAVYWEQPGAVPPMSDLRADELASAMEKTTDLRSYIVRPVSGYAHVTRNRSEAPLRSTSEPRIVCELQLDSVPVAFADWQRAFAARVITALSYVAVIRSNRRYRPTAPPKDDPVAWWRYAVRCARPDTWRTRPSERNWEYALALAAENVKYVKIYSMMLAQPSAVLPQDDRKCKEHVEWTRRLDDLTALRQIAMRKVQLAPVINVTSPDSNGKGALARWFPQWWWGTQIPSGDNENGGSSEKANVVKNTAEDEFLEAISEALQDSTLLKRDTVFGR